MGNKRMWEVGGVIAVIIAIIVFFNSSSGEKALIEAHNKIFQLEQDYVNALQMADDGRSDAAAWRLAKDSSNDFLVGIKAVDLSDCPDDYKMKVTDLINAVGNVQRAAEDEDMDALSKWTVNRVTIAQELTRIGEKHGLEIQ
jgi:hypothetical protein